MNVEVKKLALISDDRGWLTEILKSSELPLQVHFSFSKPSAVRGNHYHKHRVEWLCVTSGTARIIMEDNATKERKELIVTGDSPVLVKIYPDVTHAIENCASVPMHLLVIANEEPDSKDSDTYPRQIISKDDDNFSR
jgi:UDP-2-acetamido-2,6-beta-L-arabino-hexul-4-ose reductase